jgi:hypothetical protein
MLMRMYLVIIIALSFTACRSELAVMFSQTIGLQKAESEIFALNRLSAQEGDTVTVSGANLTDGMMVRIGDTNVMLSKKSSSIATFVMPEINDSAYVRARFYSEGNAALNVFTIVSGAEAKVIPVIDSDDGLICSDITYKNSKGEMKSGKRNCSKGLPACTSDGQSACIATSSFPSANLSAIKAKTSDFKSTVKLAGVSGTLGVCTSDGEVGCLAVSPNFATIQLAGAAAKIINGHSIAGIVGSANATLPNCAQDNAIHCVATSQFPSVVKANLTAGVIKAGVTIAGTLGQYPSAAYPLASASGTTDLTNFISQMKSDAAFEFFDSRGIRYTAAGDADFSSPNMRLNTAFENLSLTGVLPPTLYRAPGPITAKYTSSPSNRIDVHWQNIGATGYVLIRKQGGPVDWIPGSGTSYTAGAQGTSTILYVGTNIDFADTGIDLTKSYHYAVYAYDANFYYSSSPVRAFHSLNLCASATQGGSWIPVPGDLQQGTSDFCVMKYHAKQISNVATSQSAQTPWVNLNFYDSRSGCQNLGAKYALLTNEENLTVSVNIASNPANWSLGEVGKGTLNMGHTDNSPPNACEASSNDSLAWVDSDCSARDSTGMLWSQKRTHRLLSGEVVWDWGGNIFQKIDLVVDWANKPYSSADGSPADVFREINVIDTNFVSLARNRIAPLHNQYDFWNDSWTAASQGIGGYNSQWPYAGGTAARGAAWGEQQWGGIFTLDLRQSLTDQQSYIGFRCAYHP